MASLNRYLKIRRILVDLKRYYYNKVWGMSLHRTCEFSLSTRFDLTYPAGVKVGAETYIAFGCAILTHDRTRRLYATTQIGDRCFIGAHSIILPGVTISDECVIGSGSVVTKDVPPRSLVAGNPAKIIRSNILVGSYGQFIGSPTDVAEDVSVS